MRTTIEKLTGASMSTLEDIKANTNLYYISYKIRKANKKGFRYIDAPNDKLKLIQRNLVKNLFSKVKVADEAHGFTFKKSAVTNAQHHLGNNILLSIDIKDFFPSIQMNTIVKALVFAMLNSRIFLDRKDFKILISLVTYLGKLPQGAPTSPIISNICLFKLDEDLSSYFKEKEIVYTRYADDITLSHKNKNISFIDDIITIKQNLEKYDLKINKSKTKVLKRNKRMCVTGVVINDKLGTPRWYWRNLKAEMHNLIKRNEKINEKKWHELSGKITWVYTLNQNRGMQLRKLLSKIQLEN